MAVQHSAGHCGQGTSCKLATVHSLFLKHRSEIASVDGNSPPVVPTLVRGRTCPSDWLNSYISGTIMRGRSYPEKTYSGGLSALARLHLKQCPSHPGSPSSWAAKSLIWLVKLVPSPRLSCFFYCASAFFPGASFFPSGACCGAPASRADASCGPFARRNA